MANHERNCNPDPSMYRDLVTNNPLTHAPNVNAKLMTRAEALTHALGGGEPAPARAALVKYSEVSALDTGLGANRLVHSERKVWVVTIHAEVMTRGSPRFKPALAHVYSLVIDAETGTVSDMCVGCEAVK